MTGQNPGIRAHARADGDWGGHADAAIWENDLKKVKQIINGMDPGAVDGAAQVYDIVSRRIGSTMDLIYRQARQLTENWGGADADAAMKQMQKAYDAAYEISEKSAETKSALTLHAKMQSNWQVAVNGWAMDLGTSDTATAVVYLANPITGAMSSFSKNDAADHMMDQLQQQTVESNNRFPYGIYAEMPQVTTIKENHQNPDDHGGSKRGITPPRVKGTGNLPDGGTGHFPDDGTGTGDFPGGSRTDTGHHIPGGGGGTSGSGTDLAGADLPGNGGGLGGGLGGGAGAGGLGAAGSGAGGLGAGGVAGGVPGSGVMGKGGAAGAGGMPMGAGGGHGGGGDEEERERTTWLAEDEDVWGGDGDVAPPVIG